MKIRKILTIFIAAVNLLFWGNFVFAGGIDWIPLHERQYSISVTQALEDLSAKPNNIEDLYQLGLSCFIQHKDKLAVESFRRILKIDPHSYPAKWGVAEYERRIHKYGKAVKSLKDIIDKHPDFAPAYISLAYIRYMQTKFEETARLTGRVINLGKSKMDSYTNVRAHCIYAGAKGMIAYKGGPLSKAINGPAVLRHLRIARDIKPDCLAVYFGYGCYYLLSPRQGGRNLKKAQTFLEKAVTLDPLFADGYARLAQLYRLKKDKKMADFYLKKALTIDPKNILALDVKDRKCRFICDW